MMDGFPLSETSCDGATHERLPCSEKGGDAAWLQDLRGASLESWAQLRLHGNQPRAHLSDRATFVLDDAVRWLRPVPENSIHAIVTDPPYGVVEYE